MPDCRFILIIEEASLELVPRRLWSQKDVLDVSHSFGLDPRRQILDRNLHSRSMGFMKGRPDYEKRGRPDVVHFALLDATSTPLFETGKIDVYIHTLEDITIGIRKGTRPPRTLQRFCGVMSKLLGGEHGTPERDLFSVKCTQTFGELVKELGADRVICFSRQGKQRELDSIVRSQNNSAVVVWVVGGFPHGHLKQRTLEKADEIVAISERSLPAHVVTSRFCYEIEKQILI